MSTTTTSVEHATNYKVALFFRSGKPHFLAPASILIIANYDSAVGRTVKHRGFLEGAECMRQLSAEERGWAAGTTRYKLEYYETWELLIKDEEELLAADPSIGPWFLESCKQLSKLPAYKPAKRFRRRNEPTEAEEIAAIVAETESKLGSPELDAFELRAARDTARAIGADQLTLFGEDLYGLNQ